MFGKRFKLLNFAGFDIGVDISWFFIAILLSWTLAAGYFPYTTPHLSTLSYIIMGIVGMLALFFSVILHEMGHAIVARRFNVPISRITLFIFGGVAELNQEPPSPKVEFLVAIAGPIVSFIIALFLYIITQIGLQMEWPAEVTGVTGYLALINFVIVIFNLVPAFPLDGGRMLRALLWGWKNNLGWATSITTSLGSAFGFTLIAFGFFFILTGGIFVGLWWIVLGLFLNQAAYMSQRQYVVRRELSHETVQKFMTKSPASVPPNITIKQLIDEYMYQSHHHLYPVVDQGKLLGYISLKEVKAIPSDKWESTTVLNAMVEKAKCDTVTPQTNALEALQLIQQAYTPTLLVVDGEHLVGILSAQDLFKVISLKLELENRL